MAATETPANPSRISISGTTVGGDEHHNHRGRRIRKFFHHPSGRKIHVALSPQEADSLRQRLAVVSADEPFDLVINGSPEHLQFLREAHNHHEEQRKILRDTHGDAFNAFESVREELDAIGKELNLLTDQAVSLDANFSKYGYNAHLRTYDDHSSPSASRASSVYEGAEGNGSRDWSNKKTGRMMKLYKKPTIRQYFHKGLIWRASDQVEVASFELFVDLLFVGLIAINGDSVAEHPTGNELNRFAITFIMSWKIWSDLALIISWFDTNDLFQRVSVLFIMACLLGLTVNMLEAFNDTYTQLTAFYLTARLFLATYCIFLAIIAPIVRAFLVAHTIVLVVPAFVWIGSIYLDWPRRFALTWVAIFLDLTSVLVVWTIMRGGKYISKRLGAKMDKTFEFIPAMNIEHRTDRTNAFVALVFGYSVVAILYQSTAHFGLNAFFGKAVLGLIQAFCFNMIYFELDGSELYMHAIRRSAISAMIWGAVHLPFIMGYVLAAAALSKIVLATDCTNAITSELTEVYASKSEELFPIGLRWFYCAGLGLALLCMTVISLTHVHKDPSSGERLKKHFRLLNRAAVCVIFFCLPLAKGLNSLSLVSITTALVFYVLMLELWGVSCPRDKWFGGGGKCSYTARCGISRKALETAARDGNVIDVEKYGRKGGEKGMYSLT